MLGPAQPGLQLGREGVSLVNVAEQRHVRQHLLRPVRRQ
jgi:hypothetical protein